MTRFQVDWSPLSLAQMAELWIEAEDQPAFNSAVRSIDGALSYMPESQGSEVAKGLRRPPRAPIQVFFAVDLDSKTVEIASVRRFLEF